MLPLNAEKLRYWLGYSPESGEFWWKVSPNRRIEYGAIAGTKCNGYTRIKIDGTCYAAHRLAWLHYYGSWPCHEIDHINGDRSDNRIENLRDVHAKVNRQNLRKPSKRNTTGFLGVDVYRNRFRAKVGGRTIGFFETAQKAHRAYVKAKRSSHAGCTI